MGDGYTANEVLTFLAAIGVLITGLGAVIVNVIVALRTGTKLDEAAKKTDSLVSQVKEVHTLTNSGLSAVRAELATSNALNIQLRDEIADMKIERVREQQTIDRRLNEANDDNEQLEKIETNTKDTAENTKKTEESTQRTETAIKDKLPDA